VTIRGADAGEARTVKLVGAVKMGAGLGHCDSGLVGEGVTMAGTVVAGGWRKLAESWNVASGVEVDPWIAATFWVVGVTWRTGLNRVVNVTTAETVSAADAP
jgi:hypothetical protein